MNFESTISALCYTFIEKHSKEHQTLLHFPNNQVVEFVKAQHRNMPDYLKLPLLILTAIFDLWSIIRAGKRFHQLPSTIRVERIAAWKISPLKVCRDLMRFYESLTIFSYYASKEKLT
ncbi:MAG: hypothetical protein F6K48_14820 [Okeania sp. SIO3H1]|nr:hypothetical protein [Okeania sp. SIO3H1]